MLAPSATISTPVGSVDWSISPRSRLPRFDRGLVVVAFGVDPDLRRSVRLGLSPNPAGDQRAQRHLDRLAAPACGESRTTRSTPKPAKVPTPSGPTTPSAAPTPTAIQRGGKRSDGGDHSRPQLGYLVGRRSGQLGHQHRR